MLFDLVALHFPRISAHCACHWRSHKRLWFFCGCGCIIFFGLAISFFSYAYLSIFIFTAIPISVSWALFLAFSSNKVECFVTYDFLSLAEGTEIFQYCDLLDTSF